MGNNDVVGDSGANAGGAAGASGVHYDAVNDDADFWASVAAEYAIPDGIAYLNNGSFGPVPRAAQHAAIEFFQLVESNPQRYLAEGRLRLPAAKQALGRFVDMAPDDFVFVMNVTVGMNMVVRGLTGLTVDAEILTTDQEYGAVDNIWQFTAQRLGFSIRRVTLPAPDAGGNLDPQQIVDAIAAGITARTAVISFSHITSATGLVLPAAAICRLARERGITTVVDGAHVAGMVPLQVRAVNADFYVGNCHKWLGAPKGVGFLWAHPAAQQRLDPFIVGWGWNAEQPSFLGNFENPGTHNPASYLSVSHCINLQRRIGSERVAERGRRLASYARERLLALPGARALTPRPGACANSMAAYLLPALPAGVDLPALLDRQRIVVVASPGPEALRLRVATHVHNCPEHVDRLLDTLHTAYARPPVA